MTFGAIGGAVLGGVASAAVGSMLGGGSSGGYNGQYLPPNMGQAANSELNAIYANSGQGGYYQPGTPAPYSSPGGASGSVGTGSYDDPSRYAGNTGQPVAAATPGQFIPSGGQSSSASPYTTFGGQFGAQTGQANNLADQSNAFGAQMNANQAALTGQQTALSNQYLNSGNQAQYQTGMNALVPGYNQQGQQGLGMSNTLAGQINPTLGAANQVMQTAFDPQHALYNQTQQQVAQQDNAAQAARGLAMSPVGAEMSNNANQNFNIAWQAQQLANQTQGLQALNQSNASAAGLAQGANLSGVQGMTNLATGASTPYNTAQTIYGNNQTALGNQQTALTNQQNTQGTAYGQSQNALQSQQNALVNQANNLTSGNNFNQQYITNLQNYQGLGAPSTQFQQQTQANQAAGQYGQLAGNAVNAFLGAPAGSGSTSNPSSYGGISAYNNSYSPYGNVSFPGASTGFSGGSQSFNPTANYGAGYNSGFTGF